MCVLLHVCVHVQEWVPCCPVPATHAHTRPHPLTHARTYARPHTRLPARTYARTHGMAEWCGFTGVVGYGAGAARCGACMCLCGCMLRCVPCLCPSPFPCPCPCLCPCQCQCLSCAVCAMCACMYACLHNTHGLGESPRQGLSARAFGPFGQFARASLWHVFMHCGVWKDWVH